MPTVGVFVLTVELPCLLSLSGAQTDSPIVSKKAPIVKQKTPIVSKKAPTVSKKIQNKTVSKRLSFRGSLWGV